MTPGGPTGAPVRGRRAAQGARLTPAAGRERRLDVLIVVAPALLAGLLAAYQLGTRSLWLDEATSVAIASQHGAALWHAIAHDGGNMLAYYLLAHVLVGTFGDGAIVIRLPSVLASAATAAIVAQLGLRLFNRRIALSAASLTAVSLPLIFWGQDARGYALMVTFAAGSFLAFAAIVLRDERDDVSAALLAAYVLSTLLAIYMGFVAAVIVAPQLLALVLARGRARTVILALVVVAVGCLPLAVLALDRGSSQLFWVPAPSLLVLGQAARTLTSAGMPPNFHATATGTATLLLSAALLAIAAVAIALSVRAPRPSAEPPWAPSGEPPWAPSGSRRRSRPSGDRPWASSESRRAWGQLLVLAWLLVPLILALAAAKAGAPVELARSSVLLMPAVALLLAWVAQHPRVPARLAWSAVAVLLALRAVQLAPSYGASPEPWRAAAHYVLATSRAPACIAFYPLDGRMPFDYYLDAGAAPGARRLTPVLPARPWRSVSPYVERYALPSSAQLNAIARSCPALWLIASHQGQLHGPPASRVDYRRYRALLAALAHRYARQRGRSFGWAAVIRVVRYSNGCARRC